MAIIQASFMSETLERQVGFTAILPDGRICVSAPLTYGF